MSYSAIGATFTDLRSECARTGEVPNADGTGCEAPSKAPWWVLAGFIVSLASLYAVTRRSTPKSSYKSYPEDDEMFRIHRVQVVRQPESRR